MKSPDGSAPARVYLSPEDVAAELNVSVRTVYTWMSKRYFPYAKLGKHARIRCSDLEAWIDANTFEAGANVPERTHDE